MSRVKRGTMKLKRRRSILKLVKGFRFGRSTKKKMAKEALLHAGTYAFAHRKQKKRTNRALWQIKIGAAAQRAGMSYSNLINTMTKKEYALDRKSLAYLAEHKPETFDRVIKTLN